MELATVFLAHSLSTFRSRRQTGVCHAQKHSHRRPAPEPHSAQILGRISPLGLLGPVGRHAALQRTLLRPIRGTIPSRGTEKEAIPAEIWPGRLLVGIFLGRKLPTSSPSPGKPRASSGSVAARRFRPKREPRPRLAPAPMPRRSSTGRRSFREISTSYPSMTSRANRTRTGSTMPGRTKRAPSTPSLRIGRCG